MHGVVSLKVVKQMVLHCEEDVGNNAWLNLFVAHGSFWSTTLDLKKKKKVK